MNVDNVWGNVKKIKINVWLIANRMKMSVGSCGKCYHQSMSVKNENTLGPIQFESYVQSENEFTVVQTILGTKSGFTIMTQH